MSETQTTAAESPYLSPKELAVRWQCSPSSVTRITRANGLTRLCMSTGETGRNGMVRYIRKEVEALEATRRV